MLSLAASSAAVLLHLEAGKVMKAPNRLKLCGCRPDLRWIDPVSEGA